MQAGIMTDDRPTESSAELVSLRRRARLWTVVWLVSGVVAFTGNFLPDGWLDIPAVALVIFLVLWWPAHRFRARYGHETRRRETRPIEARRIGSLDRPPVLYLRSFDDDRRAARIKGQLTEEEHLGKVLSQIGPFVAVGRPGESFPTVGASRVYVGDAEWQSTVDELLRSARLVVIRTGQTTGLEWEVERAVRLLAPERLVLLVDDTRELHTLMARVRNVHPRAQAPVWSGWRSIASIRGFIVFDADWRASYLRARGPGLFFFCTDKGEVGHTAKRLAWTLRPVFRSVDVWPLIILGTITAGLFIAVIVLNILGL
jgi:hypothetical protein